MVDQGLIQQALNGALEAVGPAAFACYCWDLDTGQEIASAAPRPGVSLILRDMCLDVDDAVHNGYLGRDTSWTFVGHRVDAEGRRLASVLVWGGDVAAVIVIDVDRAELGTLFSAIIPRLCAQFGSAAGVPVRQGVPVPMNGARTPLPQPAPVQPVPQNQVDVIAAFETVLSRYVGRSAPKIAAAMRTGAAGHSHTDVMVMLIERLNPFGPAAVQEFHSLIQE